MEILICLIVFGGITIISYLAKEEKERKQARKSADEFMRKNFGEDYDK